MTPEQMPEDEILRAEPAGEVLPPTEAHERPPRVWTVFVAFPIVLIGIVVVQVVGVIVIIVWHMAHGADLQELKNELPAMLTAPVPFMIFAGLAQLVVALGAIIPARLSREPTLLRLGLVKPALPGWCYPVVALGTIFPFAVGLVPTYFLAKAMGPNEALVNLYQQMTLSVAVPFILFVAIAPGIAEELFFRGYMQHRLLQRWSPWVANLVTSCLFAIMHLDPRQMVYVFPVGLWLGVIAWRTGSVWPGMLCHAFLNGAWNVFQIGSRLRGLPEAETIAIALSEASVGFVCFCVSIWVMTRPIKNY